jgi:hypothetical protein
MPHRHVAMVLYEPAGSRRRWRRKGAGRCPLPRLFRRCVGRGLTATVEVVAAAAMEIFPSRRGLLRIPGLGVHREIPLERCGPLGGGAAARPHVRGATGVGTATSTVRCIWCLTGCSGFRNVAGGTHRGARPLSHTDVDRSLGGGSRSTTRSCCYSQRRGIQDSSPGRRWKEMGGAVDSPGVASNGEIGTHCTQGTGSNRIPEVGTKWVLIPRSLPISIATSGETHVSTSMANPLRRLICLFTKWVIKLACCCCCRERVSFFTLME